MHKHLSLLIFCSYHKITNLICKWQRVERTAMVCAFDRVVPQIASVRKRWDGRTELKETLHPSPIGAWQEEQHKTRCLPHLPQWVPPCCTHCPPLPFFSPFCHSEQVSIIFFPREMITTWLNFCSKTFTSEEMIGDQLQTRFSPNGKAAFWNLYVLNGSSYFSCCM